MLIAEAADRARRLLHQLHGPWVEGSALAIVQCLVAALESDRGTDPTPVDCAIRFRLDLSRIYLNGLGEQVSCLALGGEGEATKAAQGFWRQCGVGGRVVLVFCLSRAAYSAARESIPPRYSLVLTPDAVGELLAAPDPRRRLIEHLRDQIGRTFLSVYSICLPAGTAFFGRARELVRLTEDVRNSYAIVGPGRIGKSSLLKRYVWKLKQDADPRVSRLFEMDCTAFRGKDPNSVAREIATKIRANPRSQRVGASDLIQFLRECQSSAGPIELLLDETDELCSGEVFLQLGQAAKEGLVRLILCGRKGLHDYAVRERSPMARRLVVIRMGPLGEAEARDLICLPLEELGISLADQQEIARRIAEQSGRLPHIIQFYCKHLVELSSARGLTKVTYELIDELERDYEFFETLLSPLLELRDGHVLNLAVNMLRSGRELFHLSDVSRLASRLGLDFDLPHIQDVCDELVIQNILGWDRTVYRISHPALRRFARQAGFLN